MIVDDHWRFIDPDRDAMTVIDADVRSWCASVSSWCESQGESGRGRGRRRAQPRARPSDGAAVDRAHWLDLWTAAESAAQDAIGEWCARHVEATEPGVARAVMAALPPGALLVVASSMPVRDIDCFAGALSDPPGCWPTVARTESTGSYRRLWARPGRVQAPWSLS